jgi:hypothetical protein
LVNARAARHAGGMQRSPLQSQAVLSAGYDPATRELEIEYRTGRIYRYREVPHGVFEFLLRTPSKGGYVNRMIHGRYVYEEITPAPAESDMLQALQASLAARREEP